MTTRATAYSTAYRRRVDASDWAEIAAELADLGCALLPRLLTVADAHELINLYERDEAFRSTVTMRRHGFGDGEYRYLAAPLPKVVDELRRALYPHLVPIARDWYTKLGRPTPWPATLDEWLEECHRAGQTKPTPLILKYGPGAAGRQHRFDTGCRCCAPGSVIPSASFSTTPPDDAIHKDLHTDRRRREGIPPAGVPSGRDASDAGPLFV
jgi:hypothetical protein